VLAMLEPIAAHSGVGSRCGSINLMFGEWKRNVIVRFKDIMNDIRIKIVG